MNNVHPAIVDHYLAMLQLFVGLGFHTVVTAIDGLLMEDDYLMTYHPAHETYVRPNTHTILIFFLFILV